MPQAPFRRWEVVLGALVVAGALAWALPPLLNARGLDFGMAYRGGAEAWSSGHPEAVHTWMSTSFLALVMASVAWLPLPIAVRLHTALNLAIAATAIVWIWRSLRGRLPRVVWWITLVAAVFFSPLVSNVAYKQFNLLALGLALAGFVLVRQDRPAWGGALVAASVCLKPVALLLVPGLVVRPDTRRAGLHALLWMGLLSGGAQVFLAVRAADAGLLSPLRLVANYADRSSPWILQAGNFSPLGLLCRLAGLEAFSRGWIFERVMVALAVGLLVLMAHDVIRERPGRSWELFAFACLLSPMVSPVAWTHYQLLLAPMFLLLACRFTWQGARWTYWAALAFAYLLAELVVEPWGTLPGAIVFLLSGQGETVTDKIRVDNAAQFAQYLLFMIAWGWLAARGSDASAAPEPDAR